MWKYLDDETFERYVEEIFVIANEYRNIYALLKKNKPARLDQPISYLRQDGTHAYFDYERVKRLDRKFYRKVNKMRKDKFGLDPLVYPTLKTDDEKKAYFDKFRKDYWDHNYRIRFEIGYINEQT